MEARAVAKYVRVSPRKAGRLAKECVGKRVSELKPTLMFYPQKAARAVLSVMLSAQSNLLNKMSEANAEDVVVRSFIISRAPGMKRILYRARGRADRKERKFSHLHVVVGDGLLKKGRKSSSNAEGVSKNVLGSVKKAAAVVAGKKEAVAKK